MPLAGAVANWAAGGGLLQLHAAALNQQLHACMANLPAAAVSRNVDFGIKQLPGPFQVAAPANVQSGVAKGRPWCFSREVRVTNTGTSPLHVLNVCVCPGDVAWLTLSDDHAVSQPAEQVTVQLKQQSTAADGGCSMLQLRPGQEACFTVTLDLAAHVRSGPAAERGIQQQLLLITLLLPAAAAGTATAAAPVPGSGDVAVVLSRSITAVLVDRAADLHSCLRAEAKPFISAALRRLFDQPPAAFAGCRSPLGALLGGRQAA